MSGFYIWGAYSVTFALLAAEIVLLALRWRRAPKENFRKNFTDSARG